MSEQRAQQAFTEQVRKLRHASPGEHRQIRAALDRSLRVLTQLSCGGPRPAGLAQWGRLALPSAGPGPSSAESTGIAALTDPLSATATVTFGGSQLQRYSVKSSELLGRLAVELCSAALAEDPELLHKPALTQAVRFLVSLLAATYVGRSIEVRVPPWAACQCGLPGESAQPGTVPGSGPVHTRGTPPNVVETDAQTFLSLATGRLSWSQARAAYAVRASGSRADLSAMLPVVDVG